MLTFNCKRLILLATLTRSLGNCYFFIVTEKTQTQFLAHPYTLMDGVTLSYSVSNILQISAVHVGTQTGWSSFRAMSCKMVCPQFCKLFMDTTTF